MTLGRYVRSSGRRSGVHVGAIDCEQHHNYQGCQKPSHQGIVIPDVPIKFNPLEIAASARYCSTATRPILLPQTEQTIAAGGTISFEAGMMRTGMSGPPDLAMVPR
jgi:hypothetical protein